MIDAGWKVLAADGSEVGKVDEVTGDSNADIFDGLAIATSALGKPRYVPSEQVAEINEGTVRLKLSPEQVGGLDEYLEPATTAQIEADNKGGTGVAISGELIATPVPPLLSASIWAVVAGSRYSSSPPTCSGLSFSRTVPSLISATCSEGT